MFSAHRWMIAGAFMLSPVAVSLGLTVPCSARDLTVVSAGGFYQDAQRDVFFKPFVEKTKIPLKDVPWDNGIGVLRAKVQAGNPDWDVVEVDNDELEIGCEEGLFIKLDWSKIAPRSDFYPDVASDCGLSMGITGYILAYDADVLKDGPKSWVDFFDLTKFPGKRAMMKRPTFTLEAALIGDGVAPKDVYKVLSTPEGVDRAFRKLDTIKSNIIWYEAIQQSIQLLASHEVSMINVFNGRIAVANRNEHKNFKIVWDAQIQEFASWVILKGSPNIEQAYKWLAFFGDAENEAKWPPVIANGMPNKKVNDMVSKEVLANMPTAPENAKNALVLSGQFWLEHEDRLAERFTKWVATQ